MSMNEPNININSDHKRMKSGENEVNLAYFKQIEEEVTHNGINGAAKIVQSFPRWVRQVDVTRFLVYYETFKKIVGIHGSICEIGLLHGNCTFSMAHFSEILEPRNYTREVIGFDTFAGHTLDFDEKDNIGESEINLFKSLNPETVSTEEEIYKSSDLFEKTKNLPQFQKIKLVSGDATYTIPDYVAKNPGLLVSMIILGTDIYSPTSAAFKHLYPLMPKGGIVLICNANFGPYSGETQSLIEDVGISNIKLQRFDFATKWSYFVKE